MPRFDSTGPNGQGSKTGRGLGNCNPKGTTNDTQTTETNVANESAQFGFGRGLGRGRRAAGRGMGRGIGRGIGRNGR